jgi:nicotinate-nucleotide pyrophosphorylase (carboxylating)
LQPISSTFGAVEQDAAKLIGLALAEDLRDVGDLTCRALIDERQTAAVQVTARQAGVLAGGPVARQVFSMLDPAVDWQTLVEDGSRVERGTAMARVSGPLRSLLTGERTALNFLTHLSGIATLTRRFVDAVAGTNAKILDTRKTHPGYRALEKYAVRCGGGTNHRLGLFDGCLIKDNHLAAWTTHHPGQSVADAVRHARQTLGEGVPVEVEVDTLDQLRDCLDAAPDIVLLDNMPPDSLREAVAIRDEISPGTLLEASGGVTLETVRAIAETGVERISSGALTHSAVALDLAFDWA